MHNFICVFIPVLVNLSKSIIDFYQLDSSIHKPTLFLNANTFWLPH